MSESTITLTLEQAQHLLAALIRTEHKTTGSMEIDEYWAAVALSQAVNAPHFITEYWAGKAAAQQTDTQPT